MKHYCASDMHLGYERANYKNILRFLDIVEQKANMLTLCGDTFDLWRYPAAKIEETTMPWFKECLERLKEVTVDVPITIIPGNHDYNLSKAWKDIDKYDVSVVDEFGFDRVFYTHGWKFDVVQRRYSWAYGWLVSQFPYLYQKYMKKPAQMGLGRNDSTTVEIQAIHAAANTFARKNNYNFVVMGHTHVPGIYGRVVDCGDFVDSCSYVVFDDGKPTIEFIE